MAKRTDSERLDWIVEVKAEISPPGRGTPGWLVMQHRIQAADVGRTLRQAIDKAMEAGE